ncbi:MAG: type II secretion system minor pseudopilin GspK [Rubrivivax sp.]|nr:type II secretion system minor pseudopilin GspK [Rubrivivax sp.]
MRPPPPGRAQRGAALLVAMLILTLVATVAAAMVLHQQRAIAVEAAERARTQAAWLLRGAQDWARLLLRADTERAFPPHAGWARKLEESRLSQFLGADGQAGDEAGLDVFLSGEIDDAQGRYNLRRLVTDDGKPAAAEIAALRRLCEAAGADAGLADRIGTGLAQAWGSRSEAAPVALTRPEQLAWLGIAAPTLALIAPYVTILPTRTALNANTAQAPALLAAVDGLALADAQRIVQTLQREPAGSATALQALLPPPLTLDADRVGVQSRHFEVLGRLRFEEHVLEERWLFERRGSGGGAQVVLLRSARRSRDAAAPPGAALPRQ